MNPFSKVGDIGNFLEKPGPFCVGGCTRQARSFQRKLNFWRCREVEENCLRKGQKQTCNLHHSLLGVHMLLFTQSYTLYSKVSYVNYSTVFQCNFSIKNTLKIFNKFINFVMADKDKSSPLVATPLPQSEP